jgi:glutathione S-transferase
MPAKLYAVPISHPCMSAQLMLEHKGVDFERVDLMAGLHTITLRGLGFRQDFTPALRINGRRAQGTREISRTLDELKQEPRLFPADPEARRQVEEAERLGEEVLQMLARRLAITAGRLGGAKPDFSYGTTVNRRVAMTLRMPSAGRFLTLRYGAWDAVAQADLIALPTILEKFDDWIDEGVMGGDPLNAADFQVAPTVQLLLSLGDVAPAIEGRPIAALAQRVAPPYPRQFPAVMPRHWLAPLPAPQAGPAAKLNA